MEREERALAGDGDMLYGKGATGILDDAVAGTIDRAETFGFWIGDEDIHGMEMIHDAVEGDMLKRDEFVSALSGHNC